MLKKFFSFLGRSFLNVATVIGVMVLLSGIVSCSAGLYMMNQDAMPQLSDPAVLVVPLDDRFDQPEGASAWTSSPFMRRGLTLRDVVESLRQVKTDPVVKGVAFRLNGAALGVAQVQELRAAVADVRAAGKFTAIYAPSYDTMGMLYLAAAFDQIWMQPVGDVALNGFGGTMPFFKGLMDKVGVRANFIQRKEYKSAMESFTNDKFSDPARKNTETLLADVADQVVADIGRDRDIAQDVLWSAINQGVLTGREAIEARLIDQLGPVDQLTEALRKQAGQDPKDKEAVDFIRVADYLDLRDPPAPWYQSYLGSTPNDRKKHIAVVTIEGGIYADHEQGGGMMETGQLTANDIADAVRDATDDDNVAAILVRINSPGGTPSGSEDIRRTLELAREAKKPVIVSMGSVAASGGYWIATAGDQIFALPGTITGSIGVVGGKFDIEELSKKLGITWDSVAMGQNVNMFSPHAPFSFSERARMDALMDETYTYFTDLVAKGRRLKPEIVEQIARGQVWTGAAAKDKGLVDQLGGYSDAQAYLAKTLNVPLDELAFVDFPQPLTPLEEILMLLEGQVHVNAMMQKGAMILSGVPKAGVYVMESRTGF